MELFIIPLFILAVKLFVRLVQFIFRVVCYILGCISLGIDTARSRSEQRKRAELRQKELDWKMQIEQAKQEQREQDRIARIEREKTRAERDAIRWEWAVQKEADRRAELEWKRKRREQIEKERREKSRNEKQRKIARDRHLARHDLAYTESALETIAPLADKYYKEYETAIAENRADKSILDAYKKLSQLEAREHKLEAQRIKAQYQLCGE